MASSRHAPSTAGRLHKRSRSASSSQLSPIRQKPATKQSSGLDLSRPAAEHDLVGLGISEHGDDDDAAANATFIAPSARTRHRRSASSTSHLSTSSALQRPTPLPAIRQSSLPHTALATDHGLHHAVHSCAYPMSDEERRLGQHAFDPSRRSASISSSATQGAPLRLHANSSATRLAASYSQSSVSLASPAAITRPRGDTLKSIDTATSPSSRTSFDQTYRFIRGGRDSPVDAASRAASIRAARIKFDEEQRAKERKYEQEAHRQLERHHRKQLKRQDHGRALSDAHEPADYHHVPSRSRTISDTDNEKRPRPSISGRPSIGGRPSVGGRQYSDHREAHSNSLPKFVQTLVDPEKQPVLVPEVTRSRAAKGRWLRFVTWLKTRLLRMSGG